MRLARLLIICFLLAGCTPKIYSGTDETGFAHFPKNNKISPEKALELAEPYLEFSYKLRKENRPAEYNPTTPPVKYVILKEKSYYITKDNYNSKLVTFYLTHAVKVDKDTGEVTKPSSD